MPVSELLINALESTTGWTADTGITVETQGHADYIANYHSAAIAIRIPAGSSNKTATLTLTTPVDVTGYEELVLNVASLRKPVTQVQRDTDAAYTISVATSQDFSIASPGVLTDVSIPVDGFTQVTKLKIIINHADSDYLILSDFRAVKESLPSDVLNAVKRGIERERDRLNLDAEIGTCTAPAGSEMVTIATNWAFLEKNVVVKMGTETHQIATKENNRVTFNTSFDGKQLLNTQTSAKVSVTYPVEVGYYDREARLPGIAIWYDSPTPTTRNSRAEVKPECVGPLGSYLKRDGLLFSWRVQLEIVARSPELQSIAARAARAFIGTSTLWIHGRRAWFDWKDPAVDTEPVEGYDIIPRASYMFDVEVREDTWQRIRLNRGSPILSVMPELQ